MNKEDVRIDEKGYERYKDSGKLVHKAIAKKYIYDKNRKDYPLEFEEYQVHHKDENKRNNYHTNLEILSWWEHNMKHGFGLEEYAGLKILLLLILTLMILLIFSMIVVIEDLGEKVLTMGIITGLVIFYLISVLISRKQKRGEK